MSNEQEPLSTRLLRYTCESLLWVMAQVGWLLFVIVTILKGKK